MRSRTVREGSVGLLILLGLGLLVGLIFWLRRVSFGKDNYKVVVEFADVGGMQRGAMVRYRGAQAGTISAIRPTANGVEVELELKPATLKIPRNVLVQANQSGLLSEVTIDITPNEQIPNPTSVALPTANNCDRTLIVCNGSRLHGEIGISLEQLVGASTRFTKVYSDPRLYANFNDAAKNAAIAAVGVSQLTRQLSVLAKTAQAQLGSVSTVTSSVKQTANQIGTATTQTATQFGTTAAELRLTAAQASRLVNNLDTLLSTNRRTLVSTLDNISYTSDQLRVTVNRFSQGRIFQNLETASANAAQISNKFNQGQLLQNLETLSANAAQASANLRSATETLNNPNNALLLQQTLDSARATFQNAQKITSDLDELTGDPKFRQNIRKLINGLSGLVSSTQQLEQEIQVAQVLDASKTVGQPDIRNLKLDSTQEVVPADATWGNAALSTTEDGWQLPTDVPKVNQTLPPKSQAQPEQQTVPVAIKQQP